MLAFYGHMHCIRLPHNFNTSIMNAFLWCTWSVKSFRTGFTEFLSILLYSHVPLEDFFVSCWMSLELVCLDPLKRTGEDFSHNPLLLRMHFEETKWRSSVQVSYSSTHCFKPHCRNDRLQNFVMFKCFDSCFRLMLQIVLISRTAS